MADISIRILAPSDYERLFTLIRRILTETGAQKAAIFSPELWQWQCLTPGFEALVVVADDGHDLAGCYHLVSRDMSNRGGPGKMVLLQELGVLPEYRRHGLFMRMSDFAIEEVTRRGWDITYSFPNHRSFPGFIKKQSYRHVGNAPVHVRPLEPGQLLEARLPFKGLQRLIGGAGKAIYDGLFPLRAADDVRIEAIDRFEEDVNDLSRDFLAGVQLGCVRSASFLNWRFLEKPTHEYSAWGSCREGRLTAYLVTRRAPMFGTDCLLLMDFGCLDGHERDLLALIAVRMSVERGDGAVLAVTMGTHPFFGHLSRFGFVAVPDWINPRPIRFIVRGHSQAVGDEIYEAKSWLTTLADWDVL